MITITTISSTRVKPLLFRTIEPPENDVFLLFGFLTTNFISLLERTEERFFLPPPFPDTHIADVLQKKKLYFKYIDTM
jgi:hypothetical protein